MSTQEERIARMLPPTLGASARAVVAHVLLNGRERQADAGRALGFRPNRVKKAVDEAIEAGFLVRLTTKEWHEGRPSATLAITRPGKARLHAWARETRECALLIETALQKAEQKPLGD